jgi:hypothetical protein
MMRLACALVLLVALLGCERTTNLVSTRRDAAAPGPRDGAVPGLDAAPDGAPPLVVSEAGIVFCGEAPCACSNGEDDDNDGEIDGFDGECTGPYDQDEATFATGEVKQGNPFCGDCFFDGNSSSNDDGCVIATACSETGSAENAPGACANCEPSPVCVNTCLPRTPNGCDCFGCCEVEGTTGTLAILLVDTCSIADLEDVSKCPRCLPSPDCKNPCGTCELCPGKTLADLPPNCAAGGGPGFSCDQGDLCSPQLPCPTGSYCGQGCCQPIAL